MERLPEFKYNPRAIELGIIKNERTHCPVCNRDRDFVYCGPFYAIDEIKGICPWCIKDGSASAKFQAEFQDTDCCEDVDRDEYIDELVKRTPGYSGWQQERWLSHCGDFCAFQGFVGWDEIKNISSDLQSDLDSTMDEYGLTMGELKKSLTKGGTMQGYLFQCLHCSQFRLTIDSN